MTSQDPRDGQECDETRTEKRDRLIEQIAREDKDVFDRLADA